MAESRWHRRLKNKAAGITGSTEVPLPSGHILDALSGTGIATEIERGGSSGITKSVRNLREALDEGVARKARIRVPEPDLGRAFDEMRRQRLGGELTNLSGTKKIRVPKRRK